MSRKFSFQDSLLDAAAFAPLSLQEPYSWVGHMPFAAWLVRQIKPRLFVELGTHAGNSYFTFCQAVREMGLATRCHAVDTWTGDKHSGEYDENIYHHVFEHNLAHYAQFSELLRMTFDEAALCFQGNTIDMLHIDGLHTYDAVRHDFERWQPKLSPGAFVLFHDIAVQDKDFGVWRFWSELRTTCMHTLEFEHSHGLGVLVMSPTNDRHIPVWMRRGTVEQQRLETYFSSLGRALVARTEATKMEHKVLEREQQIAIALETVESLRNEIFQRDDRLVEAQRIQQNADESVARLHQAVVERDSRITNLYTALAERDRCVLDLYATLAERDSRIGELAGLYDRLGEAERRIAERETRITSLEVAVANDQANLGVLQSALAETTATATALRASLDEREEILHSFLCSRSWRLTEPLRRIGNAWRIFRDGHPFVHDVYYLARREFARHGFRGVWMRVPYYCRNLRSFRARLKAFRHPDTALFVPTPAVIAPFKLHPDLDPPDSVINASVSVVIPTYNAGPEFSRLLRKLQSQRGVGSLEIVVVDSGSHDETVLAARNAECRIVEIRPEEFTHSYSRNIGAEAATGEYLVFMVQDAYPIGDYWLHGLLRFLLDHVEERVVAASCAEFSRCDSDIMYDSMVNTHYRFLGCHEDDRIGEYRGHDHMSLRSCGQLSDVSCILSRDLFLRYRYQGDYAEDLDLGIRLIKDGYRVAMLSSIRVVHSHNRPAFYYLKRSFVDVVFLVGMFEDFVFAPGSCPRALVDAIVTTGRHVSMWLADFGRSASDAPIHEELAACIAQWRTRLLVAPEMRGLALEDACLEEYLATLEARWPLTVSRSEPEVRDELQQFVDAFLARLEHFNTYLRDVYGQRDAWLCRELCSAVVKVYCSAAGSALGFLYMDRQALDDDGRVMVETIYQELKAGI